MERTEYVASMGKIKLTDEQAAILKELPFEEQAKRFKVKVEETDWDIVYGDRIVNDSSTALVAVEECKYVRQWIVKEGMIVGVTFNDKDDELRYRFLDDCCTTYYHWIRNGIGGHHFMVCCTLVLE